MYTNLLHSTLFLISCFVSTSLALSATFPPSQYSQCGDFTVKFSGSTAATPFSLLLLSESSSTPWILSIPDSAWDQSSSSGSFSTRVPFPSGMQFIAVLEDAKGRGTGVVSSMFTVSGSEDSSCLGNTSPSRNIFSLTPSPPIQCEVQTINWTLPTALQNQEEDLNQFIDSNLNITGYIPSGSAFTLDPAAGGAVGSDNQAIWNVDIAAGNGYLFLYEYTDVDQNVIREVSPLQTVGTPNSGVGDCIRPGSPSITGSAAEVETSTKTQSSSTVGASSTVNSDGKGPSRTSLILAIVGALVGGCVIIAIVVTIFIRRRRKAREDLEDPGMPSSPPPAWARFGDSSPFAPLSIDAGAPLGISYPATAKTADMRVSFNTADEPRGNRQEATPSPLSSKRTLLGRAKNNKKATLSLASWGNRGSLSSSVRVSQYGRQSRGVSNYSIATRPESSEGHVDENGVKIRYLDLDNAEQSRQYGYAI